MPRFPLSIFAGSNAVGTAGAVPAGTRVGYWSAILCSALLAAAPADAATLFDTGAPIAAGDPATYALVADDFILSADAQITGATLQVIGTNSFANWDGTAAYYLLADANGRPGSIVAQGFGTNIALADNGLAWSPYGRGKSLSFSFASALAVAAGTSYWLAVHLQNDYAAANAGNALWLFASQVGGNSQIAFNGNLNGWLPSNYANTEVGPGTLAFSLQGALAPIPEPSQIALLGGGLLLLGVIRYTRRAA